MKKWSDVRKNLYTDEEIRASDFKVAIMTELAKARDNNQITQQELNRILAEDYPILCHAESGEPIMQLDTLLKLLAPLGKTLAIVPLEV
ncbi:MAG: helix-turn-helix domain-containing protein [Defluviitaleaceae bacterium]|nr:helix-turn-helix domain-containing protein [Defluviitaleaceae bacterium]